MGTSKTTASLANERCSITVDDHGIVSSLVNKSTGTEFICSAADGAWKVVTTLGGWTDHPVHAKDCVGTVEVSGHELKVSFGELIGSEGARLDIKLELMFELFPGSDEILCTYLLTNHSDEVVSEVWFPVIAGLDSIGDAEQTYLAVSDSLGRKIQNPARSLPTSLLSARGNRPGDRGIGYPGPGSMGWTEFYAASEGLHLSNHDASLARTTLLARREGENSFMIGLASYPFAKPGGVYRSPTCVVSPHRGDWHAGADKYRSFMHTWLPDLMTPGWLRESPAVRLVFMKHQTGHAYLKYSDLVAIHEKMKKRRMGGVPLVVYGWFAAGHDAGYPEYAAAPEMGGEEELRRALRKISDDDGRVILFVNGMMMDQSGAYYASDEGRSACMKTRGMMPYTDEYSYQEEGTVYPGKTFAVGCAGSKEWSDKIWEATDRVLDLGAYGILIDQIGGYSSHLCFDDSHEHDTPAEASAFRFDLLQQIRSRAAEMEPEFALMVEMHADGFAHFADLVHSHSYGPHEDGGEPFAEMYRYTMSDHPSTSRDAWTISRLNYAFALGLVPEYVPPDDPLFRVMERKHGHAFDASLIERLERMIRLRVKLAPHLIRGRFVDEDGITVGPANMFAKAFASAAGRTMAIVVWNRRGRKGPASVEMTRSSTKWTLHRLVGSPGVHETALGEPMKFDLTADEVAVVVAG